jgi:PKD repeat protein
MRHRLKGLFSILVLMSISGVISAQCGAAFDVQASACRETNLVLTNVTPDAASYEWDFCSGDLNSSPAAQSVLSSSLLFRARSFKIQRDAFNNYVGFALSEPSGQLMRLNFGANLLSTPSITNLGNFSNNVTRGWGFTLYQETGNWYCFIPNFDNGSLIKLSFGTNLLSTPTVQNMGNFGGLLRFPSGMTIVKEGSNVFGFVCNAGPGASEVLRLSFGSSLTNPPTASVINVPGGNFLMDISFIKECGQWIGLATSFDNRKVFYLDFTTGLSNAPTVGELNLPGLQFNPCAVSVQREGGNIYAFVQHIDGWVFRIDFGTSILDHTGTEQNLGTLGISGSNFALDMIREGSKWYAFSIDLSGSVTPGEGRLMRLSFPDFCSASQNISSVKNPQQINYFAAGTYEITLMTESASGEIASTAKSVSVSGSQAPDINFTSFGVCAAHTVSFTPQSSGNITGYQWEFGDATATSTVAAPDHAFATAGEYSVLLELTDANTCKNYVRKPVTIYNQPEADFTLPAVAPVCTNQDYIFTNQTVYDIGSNPTWEWRVNNVLVSSQPNLQYTFISATSQDVKLKALIPGCEDEIAKNLPTVFAGPKPDFSISGQCEDTNITFTNATTGTVTTYAWNFGDSQNSSTTHPVNVYANPGPYVITLTASNAAGCNNFISKPLTVYSKPQADFVPSAPPFSCSGTPTQFNDLTPPPTDSNLNSWSWNFGDTGNPQNTSLQKNPTHTYATATNYTITLTVGTNFFCSTTVQKQVSIAQTPTADFTNSTLCEDSEVTFSDASPGTNQAWNWQIGSSFYTSENPAHIFTNPGTYTVSLDVTGINNCIGSTSRPVIIRPRLGLDFSVTKNCREQLTEFTNITNDAADPIVNVEWDFNGEGSATTSPAIFTFLNTGTASVTLTTRVQSGCTYSFTKPITILEGPLAAFTATPNLGDAQLDVEFANTSLHASTYVWSFDDPDQTTSTQESPSFIYLQEGNYTVQLVATDLINCSDTTSQLIEVLKPPVVNIPYPNPSALGFFTIEWKTNEGVPATLLLVDAMGREMRNLEIISETGINRVTLDVTGQPSGLYILKVSYLNTVKTYRLVISQ